MAESNFTWAGSALGQEFSYEFDLTSELVREFAWGVGDKNSWYTTRVEPFGRPTAPPYLLSHLFASVTHDSLGPAAGNIDAWSQTESLDPVHVGSRIWPEARIVDKLIKRGRGYFRTVRI